MKMMLAAPPATAAGAMVADLRSEGYASDEVDDVPGLRHLRREVVRARRDARS